MSSLSTTLLISTTSLKPQNSLVVIQLRKIDRAQELERNHSKANHRVDQPGISKPILRLPDLSHQRAAFIRKQLVVRLKK